MTIEELLRSIQSHLVGIVGGTPLAPKVTIARRKNLTPAGRSRVDAVMAGLSAPIPLILERERPQECLECAAGLFLFYDDATVVRWPQLAGTAANSLISIDEIRPADEKTLLKSEEVTGFKRGAFTIDVDGRLIIHPTANAKIDIVVLGNPGGEWGSNTNC